MKSYLLRIVIMLALAGLIAACNPIWEAPPLQRLRASPTATVVDSSAAEHTTR